MQTKYMKGREEFLFFFDLIIKKIFIIYSIIFYMVDLIMMKSVNFFYLEVYPHKLVVMEIINIIINIVIKIIIMAILIIIIWLINNKDLNIVTITIKQPKDQRKIAFINVMATYLQKMDYHHQEELFQMIHLLLNLFLQMVTY